MDWSADFRAEAQLNHEAQTDQRRKIFGALTLTGIILICGFVALAISSLFPSGIWGVFGTALIAWPFLAAKSLSDHVMAVARPLIIDDIAGARHSVSMIVGRDADVMDKSDISRAAIESLAENTSDGVIAPLFWGVIFGLPGVVIYGYQHS